MVFNNIICMQINGRIGDGGHYKKFSENIHFFIITDAFHLLSFPNKSREGDKGFELLNGSLGRRRNSSLRGGKS